jgi:hypothetical protein
MYKGLEHRILIITISTVIIIIIAIITILSHEVQSDQRQKQGCGVKLGSDWSEPAAVSLSLSLSPVWKGYLKSLHCSRNLVERFLV